MPQHATPIDALPRNARRARRWLACAALALAACGGGGGDAGAPPAAASCQLADQKSWLADTMNRTYFWYRIAPRPDPTPYADAETYFQALLYTGTDPTFPKDRWSYSQSTEAFNRFFGDGSTLGYGVSVAGLELGKDGSRPLYVRYIEPLSPAAAAGVQRGDRVLSLNGRSAAELVVADDFSVLTPANAGDRLTLQLRRGASDFSVTLSAAVFALTPVTGASVLQTAGGRRVGYVNVKDMIGQAEAPLETAFAQFKAAGVSDLFLDLRYNGGGLVSVGRTVASYVAGLRGDGLLYARLLYSDKQSGNNSDYAFSSKVSSLGLPRVFVLAGRRTCSASEQVVNGLRGAGITVVAIGETTCGKPVGFNPTSQCGRTYSAVNFESVNQRNEGRYFDGFGATCAVAEDFTVPQGGWSDPLVDAAGRFADNGACPVASGSRQAQSMRREPATGGPGEAGESPGMIDR